VRALVAALGAGLAAAALAQDARRQRPMARVALEVFNCPSADGGVHEEKLTICADNPPFVEKARKLAQSGEHAAVCMRLFPGKGCDGRFSWSIDPKRAVWAEALAAVWGLYCPSDVQKNPAYWTPPTGKGPGGNGELCLPDVRVASVRAAPAAAPVPENRPESEEEAP
jgi:hypothetical protein